MIDCPHVQKQSVRFHYDLSTLFYRLLWGEHIHHGLWEGNERATAAQVQLTRTMARLARIGHGERVLDVGCGMGGSSLYLAREHGCRVTGVTLSPFQRRWARWAARRRRLSDRVEFRCDDAEAIEFADSSFDVVWSIECTEHLFDKKRFFERAAGWLGPGGRMAICAWLEGSQGRTAAGQQLVVDVCEGFFCPSLGSMADYRTWMESAGLQVVSECDWTDRVARTWEICERRVRRSGVRWLARLLDRDTVRFLDRFRTIREAYATGAMAYGCIVAGKPSTSSHG